MAAPLVAAQGAEEVGEVVERFFASVFRSLGKPAIHVETVRVGGTKIRETTTILGQTDTVIRRIPAGRKVAPKETIHSLTVPRWAALGGGLAAGIYLVSFKKQPHAVGMWNFGKSLPSNFISGAFAAASNGWKNAVVSAIEAPAVAVETAVQSAASTVGNDASNVGKAIWSGLHL